jgi:hypothetical protein
LTASFPSAAGDEEQAIRTKQAARMNMSCAPRRPEYCGASDCSAFNSCTTRSGSTDLKCCLHICHAYSLRVRLNRKSAVLSLAFSLVLLGAGCSGISATKSISPATFLLPGFFGQTQPAPAEADSPVSRQESVQFIAQSK